MYVVGDEIVVTVLPEDSELGLGGSAFKCPFSRATARKLGVANLDDQRVVGTSHYEVGIWFSDAHPAAVAEFAIDRRASRAICDWDVSGTPIPSGDYTLTCTGVRNNPGTS